MRSWTSRTKWKRTGLHRFIHDATIDDLDPRAIAKAREKFIELHPERETEIKAWDDATFLNKAKLTIKGQITNSTIILLGKEESEHFLSPAVCKIRWMRKKMGQTRMMSLVSSLFL